MKRVFVVTGAGISAESGIPTFRGPGGYWRNLDPTKLATPEAFRSDPELVWEWYRERRARIRASQPNAAHRAVVRLAAAAAEFLLLTQNVDDLHVRARHDGAALPRERLVQIHGDIFITRCERCDASRRDDEGDEPGVPVCAGCGGAMRPGVVWFGERIDWEQIRRVDTFLARGPCDLVLAVGTTASFSYVLEWAIAAAGRGGRLIEVTPEPSMLTPYATEVIRDKAAVALPALVERLCNGH